MEELRDLQEIYNIANEKFSQYNGKDFVLPSFFKEKVKEINNNTIEYNMYSAIITTRWGQNSGLNIYLPNQWFYVASYFTDFYNELQKYKKVALTIVTKDRLKELNGEQLTQSELSTLNQLPLNKTSKEFLVKFITDYSWWKGAKTIDRGDFYVSPILSSAKLVNASQSFVADLCAFLADKDDLVKAIIDGFDALPAGNNVTFEIYSQSSNFSSFRPLLTAIRTKPFILLAGISGTGKSRIVRELAFKSCPKYLQDKDHTTPGNYCMIEVKPNWHDSTELLGYYSNINKGYQFKKFVNFLVKAKMFPKVPFFVCLDEMNLAPVEQYFAEILSIIETRKHPKKEDGSSNNELIKTGVIVESQYFRQLSTLSFTTNETTGNSFSQDLTDRQIYMKLFDIDINTENDIDASLHNQKDLITEGLTLPDNVIIIGTVNMDDTTHQFSRKVIDRAMTIEMNGGNLSEMFGGSKNLEYITDAAEQEKWQKSFSHPFVTADEVLEYYPDKNKKIKNQVVDALEKINKALKGTPFEVSYRVLNELTIMVGVMMSGQESDEELKNIINQAVDNILLMKILPRIEGDVEMFSLSKEFKNQNTITHDNRLEWLMALAPDIATDSDTTAQHPTAKDKIKEMIDRLNNQGFTRFWP